MKLASPVLLALLVSAAPAFANVTVSSPSQNATDTTSFQLTAAASPCSSQPISSMGYSFDNGPTTVLYAASINAQIAAPTGNHILHVKSWGNQGASCTADVPLTVVAPPKVSDLRVSQPAGSAGLSSPFSVVASGTQCESQPISAMGYSLDDSGNTTIVNGSALNSQVTSTPGNHTLHVKAWGNNGASCVKDVAVSVAAAQPEPPAQPAQSGPSIPANAVATKLIEELTNWTATHDAGTTGTSTGTMATVSSPALSGTSRQFITTYTNYGGERYNVNLTPNPNATNFIYDAHIYIASPSNGIANVEMDLNQVMANGQTVIFGMQCDGWSHTWDYTTNAGTPSNPDDRWVHSTQPCNPQQWATNGWHHVQMQYSRDSSGIVTYKSVWLDGVQQDLNVTVPSAFALGWGPSLNLNFQIDGYTSTSGSSTIYLDNLTLYSW